jgi:peptide/nickel transport system ATP-binding protein
VTKEILRMNDNQLIDISDLHLHFKLREGTVKALKGVTLQIYKGEILGLVGESGCGKSVTAQCILRIVPKTGSIVRGRILLKRALNGGMAQEAYEIVDVTELDDKGPAIRDIRSRDISIIFQEPMSALSPVHTIGNQIIEALQLQRDTTDKEAREIAVRMLERVGIPQPEQRIDAYTFELSGGMRQRAMIAMALIKDPVLLIADEPTTAVDVTIQAQILELLQELQQEMGMAVLYITHNMGVIAAISQRVAVMYWGRVVEQGSVDAIFHDPKHPYTQGLIRSIPKISKTGTGKLWNIKGVVPHPFAEVPGCHFHPRCPHAIPGKCDVDTPHPVQVAPDRMVACFLYGEGREVSDE